MGGGDVHWAEYQRAKLHRDPVDRLAAMWRVAKDVRVPPFVADAGVRANRRGAGDGVVRDGRVGRRARGWRRRREEWCARAVSLAPTFARGWRELASWYDASAEDEKRKGKTLAGGYPYDDDDDDEDVDGGDPKRMSETLAAARGRGGGALSVPRDGERRRQGESIRGSRAPRPPPERPSRRAAAPSPTVASAPRAGLDLAAFRPALWANVAARLLAMLRSDAASVREFATNILRETARVGLAPSRIASPWNPPRRRRKPRRVRRERGGRSVAGRRRARRREGATRVHVARRRRTRRRRASTRAPRSFRDVSLLVSELARVAVLEDEEFLASMRDLHADVARRSAEVRREAARLGEENAAEPSATLAARRAAVMMPRWRRSIASFARRSISPGRFRHAARARVRQETPRGFTRRRGRLRRRAGRRGGLARGQIRDGARREGRAPIDGICAFAI